MLEVAVDDALGRQPTLLGFVRKLDRLLDVTARERVEDRLRLLLRQPVPLDLLEAIVDDYIARSLAAAKP